MKDNLNETRQPTDQTAAPNVAAGLILAATALEMADLSDVLATTKNKYLAATLHEFTGRIGMAMELLGMIPGSCELCPKKDICPNSTLNDHSRHLLTALRATLEDPQT